MNNYTLTCFGTRGSGQTADSKFIKYGGESSCFCLDIGNAYIVFDAGSGLATLGRSVLGDDKPVHIFIGHYHLDHIIGLPYCELFFENGREIHIYGPRTDGMDIEEVLYQFVKNPFWPVDIFKAKAKVTFNSFEKEAEVNIGNAVVTAHPLMAKTIKYENIYTLEIDDKKLVYALDYEITKENEAYYKKLIKESKMLIQDAAILPYEKERFVGWGHSDWENALRVAAEAGVEKVLFTHYGLKHTDDVLDEEVSKLKINKDKLRALDLGNTDAYFAKQGMTYEF